MHVPAVVLAALVQVAPVEAPLPAGTDPAQPWKLVRVKDGAELPVQLVAGEPPKAVWLAAPEGGEYRLEPGPPRRFPGVECWDLKGKALLFRRREKSVIRYNYATVKAPEGVSDAFDRSGYIHPVWTPSGRIVSNDFPRKHLHHHGVWFPWTNTVFEGRKVDFWNSGKKLGRIECVKVDRSFSGPVFAGFRARHRFIDLTSPDGPKVALNEVWDVRIYAIDDRFVFDLTSTQTCATDSPLVLKKYRYGGLGYRGSAEWEGQDVEFLTSEGKTRKDGHATRANWCTMSGTVRGAPCAVGFLCHPSNFRAPQNMRIHPGEPFFNWAPEQLGDFTIEPGKPYVSTYRFVVADGELDAEEMNRRWKAYARPPEVTLRVVR